MSIWSSTHEIRAKKYEHSVADPRRKAKDAGIDLAVVADYVYDDNGQGFEILPYLRLGIGPDAVILTETGATELRDALDWFVRFRKTRTRKGFNKEATDER